MPEARILSEFASAPVLKKENVKTVTPITKGNGGGAHTTGKKSRPLSAMFRRRHSTLAASGNGTGLNQTSRIATQAEFRRQFLRMHRDRVLRDSNGDVFRLHPIVMNGDCGFGAIAKGVNSVREGRIKQQESRKEEGEGGWKNRKMKWIRKLRAAGAREKEKGKYLTPKDIRRIMVEEVKKGRDALELELGEWGGVWGTEELDRLEREVGSQGIGGHWLGSVMGVMEHVIVARGLNVTIHLYQFDLGRQCVRRFESVEVPKPECHVYLFFTGPAACGHFDTLVKLSDSKRSSQVFTA